MNVSRRSIVKSGIGFALGSSLTGLNPLLSRAGDSSREKRPVAAVVTTYHKNSHADVIVGKILDGYQQTGGPGPDRTRLALHRPGPGQRSES